MQKNEKIKITKCDLYSKRKKEEAIHFTNI